MQSPQRQVQFWALALLAALFFLFSAMRAHGQESETQPTITLSQLLTIADESLARLETRLQERKAQIESLQIDLLSLQIQLAEASTLAAQSQSELTATKMSLESLEMQYEALSKQLDEYRAENEKQIRILEFKLKIYQSITIGASVSLVATGVYILGDQIGWW